jgi:hypothetical protein
VITTCKTVKAPPTSPGSWKSPVVGATLSLITAGICNERNGATRQNREGRMSLMGHKQPNEAISTESASTPKATGSLRCGRRRLGLSCRLESGSLPRVAAGRGACLSASIGSLT